MSRVSLERTPQGRTNRGNWSRKQEEYIADFELVSRRNLDAGHYRIFRYHYLLGADWRLCCRRLGMSRGNFYHAVYRIQERLGKVFFELEPYALFPPRDYFIERRLEGVTPTHNRPRVVWPRRPQAREVVERQVLRNLA